jgi:hypothetical protein
MTQREMECIGIALDELIKAGMMESVQKIVDVMAGKEKKKNEEKED